MKDVLGSLVEEYKYKQRRRLLLNNPYTTLHHQKHGARPTSRVYTYPTTCVRYPRLPPTVRRTSRTPYLHGSSAASPSRPLAHHDFSWAHRALGFLQGRQIMVPVGVGSVGWGTTRNWRGAGRTQPGVNEIEWDVVIGSWTAGSWCGNKNVRNK